ncbi:DUF2971 domain-containing protein [Pantoea agglomerans]|uniref:DUF2971 domain-containing protein n=1 Tax=Enterobacter agglomerans TaxID=549 RepID=UPI0012FB8727|nr:DUF2971 domain-containing protein [Pantoea agglomerans]MVT83208.1 DUF2971 domain-containing protein [Pantoea agglomerans]
MSFFKYVSIETLEKILAGSIRLTQPGAFNDPFELAVEVYNPHIGMEGNIELRFDVLSPARDINKYLLQPTFSDDKCNDIYARELRSKIDNSIGMLCVTKNESSHLMWAHYACEYSGAVIEFDESHDFFRGAFEIEYIENRPKFHMDYFLSGEPLPISEICLKSEVWRYEKEWRIARSLRDCKKIKAASNKYDIYTMEIPLDAIKCVTLGERCKLDDAKKTYHKLKNTSVALKIAALANWNYEFRYELIKIDVPISEMPPLISPYNADIFLNEKGSLGDLARWAKQHHPLNPAIKWRL